MVRARGAQRSLAQERSERRALRAFTLELAREAARRIRRAARPSRARTKSSSADLLTATDLRVEAFLRRRIAAAYPRHAIVAEESADLSAGVDLDRPTWFLDPVDGTTNYFRGVPHYACNIGFWDGEQLLVGATADVARRRIHWAQAGLGSFVGRTRVRVAATPRLDQAVLTTGFPYDRAANPARNNLAAFGRITPLVRDVRRLGCAGLDMAWVACGLIDGYWEHDDGPWDWAVGALLVREAGGSATTYDGRDWRPGDATMLASNGRLHGAILDRLDPSLARRLPGRPDSPRMSPAVTVLEQAGIDTNTWWQLVDLLMALALSALIGLEREYHQKSAGLRTHTLVGLGTALFVLVSKYGFADVMYDGITRYDPARVAAQIVSGIGFLGGGLIFVRRDAVRGLTTAATIWVTCAVGMACGAHLYWLAIAATIGHFVITFGLVHVARTLPTSSEVVTRLVLTYEPGRLVLARVLSVCTEHGFVVADVSVDRSTVFRREVLRGESLREEDEGFAPATLDSRTCVTLLLRGKPPFNALVAAVSDIPGLITVHGGDPDDVAD